MSTCPVCLSPTALPLGSSLPPRHPQAGNVEPPRNVVNAFIFAKRRDTGYGVEITTDLHHTFFSGVFPVQKRDTLSTCRSRDGRTFHAPHAPRAVLPQWFRRSPAQITLGTGDVRTGSPATPCKSGFREQPHFVPAERRGPDGHAARNALRPRLIRPDRPGRPLVRRGFLSLGRRATPGSTRTRKMRGIRPTLGPQPGPGSTDAVFPL
jgi:hypothetical protein